MRGDAALMPEQEEGKLKPGERIDDLQRGGLRIIQQESGFRFGTDAVLLADFAKAKRGERVVDMGTGTGCCPCSSAHAQRKRRLTPLKSSPMWRIWPHAVCVSTAWNRASMYTMPDCRRAAEIIGYECTQLCVTNPPYTRQRAGLVSPQSTRARSRSDAEDCTLAQWMAACSSVLQYGGRLCVVFPAPRFLELCDAMRAAHVEPKRVRFVSAGVQKPPKLVLLEGRKRGGVGLHILPPLMTHNERGRLHR